MTAAANSHAVALDRLLERVRFTHDAVGERYPLFADPATGVWTTTRRGSWTGGYWTGLLWLHALATDRNADWVIARQQTARLRAHTSIDTVTRGMTFWYGAAIGDRLTHDRAAGRVAIAGARALADAWNPELDIIPTGQGLGGEPHTTTIDGVVGLVALLAWASEHDSDERLQALAERHANRHATLCLRADGSIRAHPAHDGRAGGPVPHHWARGQAWAMLAFSQAAQWLASPRCHAAAVHAAEWWLQHVPIDDTVRWDLGDPSGPADTSAAAIAAVALLRLAAQHPGRVRYADAAHATIATLTTRHLTPRDIHDARPRGVLLDGCYHHDTAPRHELVWGTFFLTQALAITTGLLDPLAL